MSQARRTFLIHELLKSRKVVPLTVLAEELEVSERQVKRDIAAMRRDMKAPIE